MYSITWGRSLQIYDRISLRMIFNQETGHDEHRSGAQAQNQERRTRCAARTGAVHWGRAERCDCVMRERKYDGLAIGPEGPSTTTAPEPGDS